MDKLPARLAALVDAARTAHDPNANDAQRVGDGLSTRLPDFQQWWHNMQAAEKCVAAAASDSAPSARVARANTGLWVTSLAVFGLAALGSVLATRPWHERTASPTSAPAALDRHEAAVPERAPAHAPATLEPAQPPAPRAFSEPANAPQPSAASAIRTRPAKRPNTSASVSVDQTRDTQSPHSELESWEELALIRRASQALRDQQPAAALELLQQHAARFPTGVLTQERTGMTAIALCERGQTSEGRALRQQFLASAPDSPLAGRVRNACTDSGGDGPAR